MNYSHHTTRSGTVTSYGTSYNTCTQNKPSSPILETLAYYFLLAGIICFTISLFLNVFFTSGDDISGFWVLVTGWLGFIFFQFAWYANPLSLLAILLMKRKPVLALLLCLLGVTLASEVFLFNEIPAVSGDEKIYIKEFGLGAYVWYTSQWFIMCSTVLNVILKVIQSGVASEGRA